MSDAYSYSTIFSDDPRTGALTPQQLDARRKIVAALATRNRPYPKTIGEGLAAFGEGLGEGIAQRRLEEREAQYMRSVNAQDRALSGMTSGQPATRYAPSTLSGPQVPPTVQDIDPLGTVIAPAPRAAADPEEAQPYQVASLGGDVSAPSTSRDEIVQALVGPQQQQPQQQPRPVLQPQQQPLQQQYLAQAPSQPPAAASTMIARPPTPPSYPEPTPMTEQERRIRQITDPYLAAKWKPVADDLEAKRKFEDARNVKMWETDLATFKQRSDPQYLQTLQKSQEEEAKRARELRKEQERGGVSQAVIDKSIEESAKRVAPLREASIGLNQVEDLLDRGMFHGTFSKVELALAKAKAAAGMAPDPRIAATEQFVSSIKPITAAARQALAGGANISDRDLQAAEAAAGGDITLTEQGMRSIMQSLRTIQLQTALHHQRLLGTAAGSDIGAERTLYGIHGLPMETILPRNHPAVRRLMENADNEHERGLFDKAFHTPGLAERIISRNRQR